MNDQELITAVRQSVHGARMNVPAEQIVSRSRAIRASGHRRLAAGLTAVAAAGSVALGLGLSGAPGAAPNGATGTIRGTGTIRDAAFTLTGNANGTDTLTLTHSQMFDPAALSRHSRNTASPPWSRPTPTARPTPRHPTRPASGAVRPGPASSRRAVSSVT